MSKLYIVDVSNEEIPRRCFFMDDDQEERLINTAELRFWDKALTTTQVLDLGGVEQ